MENFNMNGLVCDNPKCDWEDTSIELEDFEKYIDYPYPKCGESILTPEDHQLAVDFVEMVKSVENLSKEEQDALVKFIGGEEELKRQFGIPLDKKDFTIGVKLHKGVSVKSVDFDKD